MKNISPPCLGQLTLYLGKRDYVDHVSSVDKVGTFLLLLLCVCSCIVRMTNTTSSLNSVTDGVVKLDPADFGDRKGDAPFFSKHVHGAV